MPSPFVYWAQSDTHVFLKVDVKQVSRCQVRIEEEGVEFSAVGVGGHGQQMNYEFTVEFYLPVDAETSGYDVGEREVAIRLVKKEPDWWPRLLYEQKKLPWLKIDFDRWRDQDESDNEDEEGNPFAGSGLSSEEMLRQQYPDVFEKLQREELGFISEGKRKVYLFCYNLFMFCGFLYVFLVMSLRYSKDGDDFIPVCYKVVGPVMQLLHLLMFLEVLHPMFGYTKGGMLEPFLQVSGRTITIFLLIEAEPRMHDKPVVFYLFAVYSAIELVRYPYYMLRVYDVDNGLITWLRYTMWVPLYPCGFVCEGVIALRNIPYFEETGKFSLAMPNQYNLAFHFPSALRIYLLFFFFPVLYTMMNHMYHQRCKKLGIIPRSERLKNKDQ